MQFKLNMPVLTSTYPSIQVYNNFPLKKTYGGEEGHLPQSFSLKYRWTFFYNYQLNKYKKYVRINDLKSVLAKEYHKHIDDWD